MKFSTSVNIERDNNIFGLPNMYYWKVFKSNIFGNYYE